MNQYNQSGCVYSITQVFFSNSLFCYSVTPEGSVTLDLFRKNQPWKSRSLTVVT